jgi:hypothetical protein
MKHKMVVIRANLVNMDIFSSNYWLKSAENLIYKHIWPSYISKKHSIIVDRNLLFGTFKKDHVPCQLIEVI